MLKWVGAALILFSGTAYGFVRASAYAKRPRELRQLGHALMTLESEIVYGVSPLPSALSRVAAAAAPPISELFAEASARMGESGKESTAGDCWRGSVHRIWPRTSLKDTEKEVLLALAPTLGVTDREDQSKHIRFAVSQLRSQEETAREEQARYEKMWKSLGALTAALIVILMY